MDFEDFEHLLPQSDDPSCECRRTILFTSVVAVVVTLFLNYVVFGKQSKNRIVRIQYENKTLKHILLKSLENKLLSYVKNGIESEDEEEE